MNKSKSVNLKLNNKFSWHGLIDKRFLVIYLSLALVLIINQIVFSIVLKDREKIKAFNQLFSGFTRGVTNLGDQIVSAGTNDVTLAEFYLPDGQYLNENVACGIRLDNPSIGYDNPCLTVLDADGAGTAGPGTDDDGAEYIFELEPNKNIFYNIFFTAADGLCVDNLKTPSCMYIDKGDAEACDGTTTGPFIIGISGCETAKDQTIIDGSDELKPGDTLYDVTAADRVCSDNNDLALATRIWTSADDGVDLTTCTNDDTVGITFLDPGGAGSPPQNDILIVTGDNWATTQDTIFSNVDFIKETIIDLKYTHDYLVTKDGDGFRYLHSELVAANGAYDYCDTLGSCGASESETIWYNAAEIDTLLQTRIYSNTCNYGMDFAADCDGADTITKGYCDPISNGDTLTQLAGTEKLCTDSLTNPKQIYVHESGYSVLCDDSGIKTRLLSSGSANIPVGTNWAFKDSNSDGIWQIGEDLYYNAQDPNGNPNTVLGYNSDTGPHMMQNADFATWPTAVGSKIGFYDADSDGVFDSNEPVVIDADDDGQYDSGETVVYESYSGTPSDGDLLIMFDNSGTVKGPAGSSVYYIDENQNGSFDCGDSIYEDNGNYYNGLTDNGKLDISGDRINVLALKNLGNANFSSDVTNVRLYADMWFLKGIGGYNPDGRCGVPFSTPGDHFLTNFGSSGNMLITTINPDTTNLQMNSHLVMRVCIIADIAPTAINGRTIKLQIPFLKDSNLNGMYNPGDEGIFLYSQNDGLSDEAYNLPYTITIQSSNFSGHGGMGATIPDDVGNLEVKADESGKVALTWDDPQSYYLKEIVIIETINNESNEIVVPRDIESAVFENRVPGKTYSYLVKSRGTDGRESQGIRKTIVIPLKGETTIGKITCTLPADIKTHELVKSPSSAAVYYIGADNCRHLFINETVYRSWYPDFKSVRIISDALMEMIGKGKDVYLRPGTYLVKSASDPKVYAVVPGGKLSWLKNENIASVLYGPSWAKKVLVLSDNNLAQYAMDVEVNSVVHPNASLISYVGSKAVYYIENGLKRFVSASVMALSRFQDRFINKNIDPVLTYPDGPAMTTLTDIGYWE